MFSIKNKKKTTTYLEFTAFILIAFILVGILSYSNLYKTPQKAEIAVTSSGAAGISPTPASLSEPAPELTDEPIIEPSPEQTNSPAPAATSELKGIISKLPQPANNSNSIGTITIAEAGLSDNVRVGVSYNNANTLLNKSCVIIYYGGLGKPGGSAPVMIIGHNNKAFNNLKKAKVGNKVVLALDYGTFTYEIKKTEVKNTKLYPIKYNYDLTLSTCYPYTERHHTDMRAIFYAELVTS